MAEQNAPRFKSGEVAAAAGMRPIVFSRWLDRGIASPAGCDKATLGSGDHRLFSARTATKISIAHALTRVGIVPSKAVELASEFSDSGQTGREPGALFPIGKTILLVTPKGGGKVFNLKPGESIEDALTEFASIIVDCNRAVQRVNAGLGLSAPDTAGAERILRQLNSPQKRGADKE